MNIENQPLSKIEWVKRDQLRANDYNPNYVMPPEKQLLKISILEDGWTQPIVAREDGEIVDGFHRWMLSEDEEIAALTDGLVPVVRINPPEDQQMMATIRHNRARGSHIVLRMADIVSRLIDDQKLSKEEVASRLMMEEEEVDRLYTRGVMIDRGSKEEFNNGWIPKKSERSMI